MRRTGSRRKADGVVGKGVALPLIAVKGMAVNMGERQSGEVGQGIDSGDSDHTWGERERNPRRDSGSMRRGTDAGYGDFSQVAVPPITMVH